ncbi:MAG: WYL domain-containing protein, partial [Chitinophagaceae bacterium]
TAMDHAKPERVLLSFTPFQSQYILSQPLHHTQKLVKQNDLEVQVEIEVYITHELIMNILSFGAGVTVIEPGSLRETLKSTIEIIRKNYE